MRRARSMEHAIWKVVNLKTKRMTLLGLALWSQPMSTLMRTATGPRKLLTHPWLKRKATAFGKWTKHQTNAKSMHHLLLIVMIHPHKLSLETNLKLIPINSVLGLFQISQRSWASRRPVSLKPRAIVFGKWTKIPTNVRKMKRLQLSIAMIPLQL